MEIHEGPSWEPGFLGPLDQEFAPITGSVRFFAGEERFLSPRKLEARERLWHAIRPVLDRVLEPDEKVLYVAPVVHNPKTIDLLGFGMWYVLFFKAALVLTDRRAVEILLKKRDRVDTRVFSYSWAQAKTLKLKWGTLTLKPAKGRAQRWSISEKGDRKLLKLLIPKIDEQLVAHEVFAPRPVPLWHCPECGAATPKHPAACSHCGVLFKSRGLAAALAVAFPGVGLVYAGHPVLAALDFFGEFMLFVFVAVSFLIATGPEEIGGVVFLGAFFFLLTKLESAHLATVLVHRTRPEKNRTPWRVAIAGGAVASLALMAVPPLFSGLLAGPVNLVDRDLDLAGNDLGWSGGLDPDAWVFGVEPNQRSEWIRDDGQGLFVWSLPLGPEETEDVFISTVSADVRPDLVGPIAVGGFDGIRVIEESVDEEGEAVLWVRWMLFDRDYADVHILAASSYPGEVAILEAEVDRLVRNASWIAATY